MEEGTFGGWLRADGERILKGELLFVLEGDKATQEIETFDSGILCIPPNAPRVGELVKVGQVIGFLLEEGEERPSLIRACEEATEARPNVPATTTATSRAAAVPQRSAGPAARRSRASWGLISMPYPHSILPIGC